MYTNKQLVEDYLKRTITPAEETHLRYIMAGAESYINGLLGFSFGTVAQGTRYYTGNGLFVDLDPMTEITSVKMVDNFQNILQELIINEDYTVATDTNGIIRWLERRYQLFPNELNSIQVTGKFTAGNTIPDDVKYLATVIVGDALNEGSEVGLLQSESIEGYSRTFATSADKGFLSKKKDIIDSIIAKYTGEEAPFI